MFYNIYYTVSLSWLSLHKEKQQQQQQQKNINKTNKIKQHIHGALDKTKVESLVQYQYLHQVL